MNYFILKRKDPGAINNPMVVCIFVGLFWISVFVRYGPPLHPTLNEAMGFEENKRFLLWSWCHPFIPDAYRTSVNGNTEPLRESGKYKRQPGVWFLDFR